MADLRMFEGSSDLMAKKRIKLSHGAGGRLMQDLIATTFFKHLKGSVPERESTDVPLEAMDDSAVVDGIVFTTDSHTVKPLFFPGGDIGRLSVAGTVNDLAVMGAEPLALSLSVVLEDGYPLAELERIMESVAKTCREAGVPVVTGDTKVVEHGAVDKLVTNTAGIGRRSVFLDANIEKVRRSRGLESDWLLDSNLRDGDVIILSGTVGDHGIALLSHREGYEFQGDIESDVAPLNGLIEGALKVGGIVCMKDPTRGGIANALNEIAEKSGVGISVDEEAIPISQGVASGCEILGLDPLEIANEGKVLVGVIPEAAEEVLGAIREHHLGSGANIIGRATGEVRGVVMNTVIGGRRIVEAPVGDPIPRIC